MKKIGVKYPVCAVLNESTGSCVYSNAIVIGKLMQVGFSWEKGDAELYADDSLDDSDQSITSGTCETGLNELTYEVQSLILGHTLTNGELITKDTDVAPFVGYGFYSQVKRNGAYKWRAVWLKKVQWAEPDDETNTKGASVEFQTPSISGKIAKAIDGRFKEEKLFDTEVEAIAYIRAKSGLVEQVAKVSSSLASGTYTELEVEGVVLTSTAGATIYYTTNGTTPSATNGTEYTTAIDIVASTGLKAIGIKSGMSDSEVSTFEYIITV